MEHSRWQKEHGDDKCLEHGNDKVNIVHSRWKKEHGSDKVNTEHTLTAVTESSWGQVEQTFVADFTSHSSILPPSEHSTPCLYCQHTMFLLSTQHTIPLLSTHHAFTVNVTHHPFTVNTTHHPFTANITHHPFNVNTPCLYCQHITPLLSN